MNAVTVFLWTVEVDVLERDLAVVRDAQVGDREDLLAALDLGRESSPGASLGDSGSIDPWCFHLRHVLH